MKIIFNPEKAKLRGSYRDYTRWADRLGIDLSIPIDLLEDADISNPYYLIMPKNTAGYPTSSVCRFNVDKEVFDIVMEWGIDDCL